MQFRRLTFISVSLILYVLAGPGVVFGQKVKVKGQAEVKGDAVKVVGGKGSIKGAQSTAKDTLLGGDGFIPRTVIDSFPANPAEADKNKKSTSLQYSDIESARKQIAVIRLKISTGDSLLAANKKSKSQEWPESKLAELEKGLLSAKQQLSVAEKDLSVLEKRYLKSMEPVVPEARKTDSKPAAPKSGPSPKPAPPVVTGTGKGEIKGGK